MASRNRLDGLKAKILPVLKKYDVKKTSFFGSLVRGTFKKNSDIDILVELSDELSLFDFIGLKNDLEDVVKRKVDLVEFETIKKSLKMRILAEQVTII